ncbi:MAG TPA: hypothetical protein PLP05_09845, partial [Sedimentisphaerales bacterium]|nr:hypothetical protein [Sedimentisphaerales bacterium]
KSYSVPPENKWLHRLWAQTQQRNKGIVARTIICQRDNYIAYLKKFLPNEYLIPNELANCPRDIIITEISLPDLYTSNKHKLGDLISDGKIDLSTGSPRLNFIWGWLPGIQIPVEFKEEESLPVWEIGAHIPLFRNSNALQPNNEW